jgi:hypothetical protein
MRRLPVRRRTVWRSNFGKFARKRNGSQRRYRAEDCALQSMPDASSAKWHLAHTSWFFETFALERAVANYVPFHPQFRMLFNLYYVAVGPRHPPPERGLLSRSAITVTKQRRYSVTSGNGRKARMGPILDTGRQRARSVNTTANSWSTSTCCAADPARRRVRTSVPRIAIFSLPLRAGSSAGSGSRATADQYQ